ncbi:TetR/AcrR family transcriptional regulator [Ponticaulis sp.]|uniref:TetR/AcrR family transcriptional regulator n=1 Tax=Ponticaulis sp. TaxID=2020902 RepID=UPI000B69C2D7|nr:TetR/AcrR family transcriptional regulator [Ponticaulis sp.]MAI89760.1 TetR family transcriptional regulator [Ponticaulis sp.]OUY00773.1 MAG: hypothetical protein CBB65_04920 [Hyphomonadaceae bacterium TMED5]|tara:strand:+ start:26209 stop:26901 length:693 start_codon:yes stop_codon:yes gene_type:complete
MDSDISTFSGHEPVKTTQTPASRRREKVRQTILEAAERVFAEEGYEGLSIRRLAEEIDYSPSAIYKYFASKTELVGCLKEAFFIRLVRNIENAIEGQGPGNWESVRDCTRAYVTTALEKPHHYLAGFAPADDCETGLDTNTDPKTLDDDSPSAVAFRFLCEGLEEGKQSGNFRQDLNVRTAALSIVMAMHGAVMTLIQIPKILTRDDGTMMDLDEMIEMYSDQLLRGFKA